MKISVLQWNVLFQEKADNVLALIKQVNADVVCLQELTQNSLVNPSRDLPAEIGALGYHYYYEATGKEPDLTIGNGIFSKSPVTNPQLVYLSRDNPSNPDYPQFNRAYIEADVHFDKHNLLVGTVHLSYTPGFVFFPSRQPETDKFLEIIGSKKERFVITGDFNAMPDSPLIKRLDGLLVPAGPDYREPTWTTKPFDMHNFRANSLDWRLDYIFTTPDVKVLSSKILQTDASDHLPVLAEIEV